MLKPMTILQVFIILKTQTSDSMFDLALLSSNARHHTSTNLETTIIRFVPTNTSLAISTLSTLEVVCGSQHHDHDRLKACTEGLVTDNHYPATHFNKSRATCHEYPAYSTIVTSWTLSRPTTKRRFWVSQPFSIIYQSNHCCSHVVPHNRRNYRDDVDFKPTNAMVYWHLDNLLSCRRGIGPSAFGMKIDSRRWNV